MMSLKGRDKMKYQSTRNSELKLDSAEAIKIGIAPDGGLFVPVSIPKTLRASVCV